MDYITCCLRNLNCSEYKEPILLKSKDEAVFYLVYQEKIVLDVIQSYNFMEDFGRDSARKLAHNFFCYYQTEFSTTNLHHRKVIVNNQYMSAQKLSNALWFIKDNSVTPNFATISSDSQLEPQLIRRSVYYTDAGGGYNLADFNMKELHQAMKWYNLIDEISPKIEVEKVDLANSLVNMSNYLRFDIPSFQRAYYFLDLARKTEFLPGKITSYISILESLFAVKGENTHKVAERTANFIEEDESDRYTTFKAIVNIYKVRSDFIHGSEIKHSTQQSLPQTSKELDSIVRRVLTKMYSKHPELNYKNKKDKKNTDTKNFEEVNDWFNQLAFSKK
ncbi:hypothetical protein ACR0S4_17745 [Priestia megaterium]|uniref:hypothetical protein n=1 Tax=Priestia megaterium TaxID=1404 RepID=UPI003D96A241